MPLRPCTTVGCPELVRSGACSAHSNEPVRKVYSDPRWRKARQKALVRAGHRCQATPHEGPRCPVLGSSETLHAHHHYPGGVKQMLRDGVDPFDVGRIIILCEPHHRQVEELLRRGRKRPFRR